MNERDYAAERRAGAEQIIAKAKELAKARNIEIDAATWTHDAPNIDHSLTVSADGRMASARFADEQLVDYPGRVGAAKTDGMLHDLVQQLAI